MNEGRDRTVGLVGIGAMGRGVALNLLAKGHRLIGFDVRPEARQWLVEQGGGGAQSLADLGRQCEAVLSFVVDDRQTESILFEAGGLAESMKAGSVFIACSTLPPAYVRSLEGRLLERGLILIDAPVTGGAAGARAGTLTVMAAGERRAFDGVRPVLEAFGARVHHLAEQAGAGAQLKIINQLLCGVHLAAAGEALALAKQQGLPLQETLEILCSGAGSSWMLRDRGPRMVAEAFGDVTSAVDIFVKDLGLVLQSASETSFTAPLASAAHEAFVAVARDRKGRWDDSAVLCHFLPAPGGK